MPRLAIAMTTYNGMPFLEEQLRSFAAQTRLPDQLVACDDGSSDDTIKTLEEFARSVPFEVKIVRNPENLGHERNFGKAMALADGDIIALSDQDDRWDEDKLATIERAFAEDDSALLIVNDVRMTDEALNPTGRTLLGQLTSSGMIGLDQRGLLIGCGTSYRSRLSALVLPVPALDYGHDTWINEFAAFLGAKKVLPRPLQDYRRHQSNASESTLAGSDRATPWSIMRPSRGKDLSPMWQRRVDALDEMRRRVAAIDARGFAALGIERSQEDVLADIAGARDAVVRRMGMFRKGWWARKLLAGAMMVSGDYRHFSGWRSFAKDLVR